MSILLVRLGRSTLSSRAQWAARTSHRLLARASTAAGQGAPVPDDSSSTAPPSADDDRTAEIRADFKALMNGIVPDGSKNSPEPPRGRKISRKSRRSQPALPKSFVNSNYTPHSAIKVPALHPSYADTLSEQIWHELRFAVHAGLAPKGALALSNHTDHLLLNIPGRGATYMQDIVAKRLAADAGADMVVFDPQDFTALAQSGDMGHLAASSESKRSDARGQSIIMLASRAGMQQDKEDARATGDEYTIVAADEYHNELLERLREIELITDKNNVQPEASEDNTAASAAGAEATTRADDVYSRFHSMVSRMLKAGDEKNPSAPKLVYLRDYGRAHDRVSWMMGKALVDAVDQLRHKGHRIVIFAGHSPSLASKYQNYRQSFAEAEIPLISGMKCISVPPPIHDAALLRAWESQLEADAARRIGEINARQILSAVKQKDVIGIKGLQGSQNRLVAELSNLEGIQKSLWSSADTDRHVTCAIGNALSNGKTAITPDDIVVAANIVRHSIEQHQEVNRLLDKHKIRIDENSNEPLNMSQLQKYCDPYESRFLSRIVDPFKVHGSFADVRVPQTTVDTLQSLITLPLVRPDLFRKGILKHNFISGVLLFGPPGTGKTMLAKAVAKESGSRMLEIQASDIYEMYVGEGEKNVKALFSLARKLSPCVVFIDEVDSLLSRRRSDSLSNAHREIINQFMVEWDGLSSDNQGVVVMAATNRPFDLDDAVLRRMPRRILVDLPKEEDRMEILKMLLRDEEHDVALAELARATEHYSGSDLKNLCVTAALRAAQEVSSSSSSSSSSSRKKPQPQQQQQQQQRWALTQAQFDEALKFVRPSSTEDMESLVEIRKWAAKYGDGGSERKKQAFGFS